MLPGAALMHVHKKTTQHLRALEDAALRLCGYLQRFKMIYLGSHRRLGPQSLTNASLDALATLEIAIVLQNYSASRNVPLLLSLKSLAVQSPSLRRSTFVE